MRHLVVRVEPGAESNSVTVVDDDILKVATTEPATDGAANKAVVQLVRKFLRTDRSVRIVSGHKQNNKILAIGK